MVYQISTTGNPSGHPPPSGPLAPQPRPAFRSGGPAAPTRRAVCWTRSPDPPCGLLDPQPRPAFRSGGPAAPTRRAAPGLRVLRLSRPVSPSGPPALPAGPCPAPGIPARPPCPRPPGFTAQSFFAGRLTLRR